jgi:putative ABC transport system permease protein
VVNNMVMASAYEEVKPFIYANLTGAGSLALIKLNPAISAHEAMDKIEVVFKKLDTEHPFEYQFVDQEYATKFGNEKRVGKLSSVFAALAIFISCLGLFALSSFVAEQRKKEIGIRKVMGASVFGLWRMLSKDFLSLVIVAILISIPAAYYFMHEWLMKYQYRTEINWWVIVIAGIGALLITLVTVSYQTFRAALVNPVSSLAPE